MRLTLLAAGAVWLALCVVIVTLNVWFPGPDVFQFKGAGVYFAQHGLVGGINMPFAPLNVPAVYAFYPPVYPFVFGLWCKGFGVSLHSSIAFDLVIRTLRSFAMLSLIWPFVRKSDRRGWMFLATMLLVLSLAPNNEDRPDELGLLFGLASWAWLSRGRTAVIGGVLLGLAGATSPAAGLFATLGVLFVCRTRVAPWRSTVAAGAASVLTAVAAVAPVLLKDPTALHRFMDGVRFNAFQRDGLHYEQAVQHAPAGGRLIGVLQHASVYSRSGAAVLLLFVALAVLVAVMWKRADAPTRRAVFPAAAAAFLFLPITLVVFPKEPLYLWLSAAGLAIAAMALSLGDRRYRLALVVLLCGMSMFLAREGKRMYDGIWRPADQTLAAAQARVLRQIEPASRLAGWPDTFFTIAGVRPIESLQFSCPVLNTYDYVFLTEGSAFTRDEAQTRPLDLGRECSHPAVACFTVQDDFRSTEPVTIFGWRTGLLIRGFGGVLYKRTGC